MPATTELRCLVCNAIPSAHEMTDGWCESCGKRLPTSYAAHAKRDAVGSIPVNLQTEDPSRFWLWGGVIGLVLFVVGVLVAISVAA